MKPRALPKFLSPRTHRVVRRARVLAAIARALEGGVCWISAPAGFGKTTAVVDYLHAEGARHLWYRVDAGDGDIASFFHYLRLTLRGPRATRTLPAFGPEFSDQPAEFARRFFRGYLARVEPGTILVFDDLHEADTAAFNQVLAILLRELPDSLRCVCLSRALPPREIAVDASRARLSVVDHNLLTFSRPEARALLGKRAGPTFETDDFASAHGWAAGLVLLAERKAAGTLSAELERHGATNTRTAIFGALASQLFESLTASEQDALLRLSVLPEITPDLARALTSASVGEPILEQLHRRQLLVNRRGDGHAYELHDLLREFLGDRLAITFSQQQLDELQLRAAAALHAAGRGIDAVDLAIRARAWERASAWLLELAPRLVAQGRRITLIDRCTRLPDTSLSDPWLCYWLGVANMADDAIATKWLDRAWTLFSARREAAAQCLTAARAVLAKTDSWRTHEGLATWTQRALASIAEDIQLPGGDDQLITWSGMSRAADFAEDYRSDDPAVRQLTQRLLARLADRAPGDSSTMRLVASQTLIEHAGSTGQPAVFEGAVDSVTEDLRDPAASPWVLGLWLVAFGSVSGRYFPYSKRGFPYEHAEAALRAAIEIGEREGLRGVEFGALYHLQLQMKLRNDFTEFSSLVARLATIADSRYTTQVAVVADCQAAMHTLHGNFSDAYAACGRFMNAIEAANEPPIERWPHFVTKFQALLSDRRAAEAATFLEGVLPLFDGGVRLRTEVCVRLARALEVKWDGGAEYPERLQAALASWRASDWHAALANLPALASEICGDALEADLESEFVRNVIRRRNLAPPALRPARWPWALRVHVLGAFRLERDDAPLALGPKAPTRALDILRALAIARDHACTLEQVHEWLWPDADGDQAAAACDQALHRLRKLLGEGGFVVQREGRLSMAAERVWVDLDAWEEQLRQAMRTRDDLAVRERAFADFPGPLLNNERTLPWALPAAERVRDKLIELALGIAQQYSSRGEQGRARAACLRALEIYPTSERCYEALMRGRLANGDVAGALEDYRRYERVVAGTLHHAPSPILRALVATALPQQPPHEIRR